MPSKKVTTFVCALVVISSSLANAGWGSKLRKIGRSIDPSRVAKKAVKEFERIDDNAKKYVKNPSDLVRNYIDTINPVKAIEEVSRGVGKIAGGELGEFANKVKTESSRINKDIDTAVEGASDALRLALTHPKEGLPRMAACVYTVCASEVVLHKRVEKIKREKREEYNRKVEEMERQQSADLKNLVQQRIVELNQEMDQLEEQIVLTERALQISTLINSRLSRATIEDRDNANVVAALSTPETQRIASEMLASMGKIYANPENISDQQIEEYRKLEDQLTMVAISANVQFNVLIAAIVDGMSNGQNGLDQNFKNAILLQGSITTILNGLYREGSRAEFELEEQVQKLAAL